MGLVRWMPRSGTIHVLTSLFTKSHGCYNTNATSSLTELNRYTEIRSVGTMTVSTNEGYVISQQPGYYSGGNSCGYLFLISPKTTILHGAEDIPRSAVARQVASLIPAPSDQLGGLNSLSSPNISEYGIAPAPETTWARAAGADGKLTNYMII